MALLSLDQTDSNLLRDFRWVARQTRKFPRKYTQVAKKKKKSRLRAEFARPISCISLANRLL